jgi:deazaflavin-dependent oxidoreductase (nitroreductase family)
LWAEQNRPVIERLRGGGKGRGGDREMVILNTIGAKSGRPHTVPVMFLRDGDRYVVFASIGGAPRNPAWYHNLIAHPDLTIEVGGERIEVRAVELTGAERDEIYARQVRAHPFFAGFQKKTKRVIPVVALVPRSNAP